MKKKRQHILVIRLSAMGDVAMSLPVIKATLAQNKNIEFTILSRAYLQPLFKDIDRVNFYAAEVKGKHKGILGLYKLYKELKKLRFDAIADIHNVLRSKILRTFFSLSRIKIATINKGRAEKKALTRTQNKVFKPLKTTHERYADVLRALGFTVNLNKLQKPTRKDLNTTIINNVGNDNLKWIGIAPFAQYESKMYPLDLIEKVIEQLAETNHYKILLFGGGEKEVTKLNRVAASYNNTINVAGKLNLEDELRLISNLDCMLSMDSANGHLAVSQGVKTITIWGITHPFAGFVPFNQPEEYQILPDLQKYPNLPCSIYGNKVCDGYEDVMRSIPFEKLVEKIQQIAS